MTQTIIISYNKINNLKLAHLGSWYASGCVVEWRFCNREVAGSNLGLGYFATRFTQPSIPPGSVNEYQLRLERHRQVWLIPLTDETQGVQVKLCYPLTMHAIPERLRARCTSLTKWLTERSCNPPLETFRVEALYKSTTFMQQEIQSRENRRVWYSRDQQHINIHIWHVTVTSASLRNIHFKGKMSGSRRSRLPYTTWGGSCIFQRCARQQLATCVLSYDERQFCKTRHLLQPFGAFWVTIYQHLINKQRRHWAISHSHCVYYSLSYVSSTSHRTLNVFWGNMAIVAW